jgi:hypothetical protein
MEEMGELKGFNWLLGFFIVVIFSAGFFFSAAIYSNYCNRNSEPSVTCQAKYFNHSIFFNCENGKQYTLDTKGSK